MIEFSNDKKKIRYFSTLRIRKLLRECKKSDFHTWGIELLYSQLTDSWEEIQKTALRILAEACEQAENLDALISLRPNVLLLERQPVGYDLLLKLSSRDKGFDYLYALGWVQKTLKEWREKRNLQYVTDIEQALKRAMSNKEKKYPSIAR